MDDTIPAVIGEQKPYRPFPTLRRPDRLLLHLFDRLFGRRHYMLYPMSATFWERPPEYEMRPLTRNEAKQWYWFRRPPTGYRICSKEEEQELFRKRMYDLNNRKRSNDSNPSQDAG